MIALLASSAHKVNPSVVRCSDKIKRKRSQERERERDEEQVLRIGRKNVGLGPNIQSYIIHHTYNHTSVIGLDTVITKRYGKRIKI